MDKLKRRDKNPAKRPRYDLDKLLDQITPDNQPEVFDDAPVGDAML